MSVSNKTRCNKQENQKETEDPLSLHHKKEKTKMIRYYSGTNSLFPPFYFLFFMGVLAHGPKKLWLQIVK